MVGVCAEAKILDLGDATDYAVLGDEGSYVKVTHPINGDVGVGDNGALEDRGGTFNGDAYVGQNVFLKYVVPGDENGPANLFTDVDLSSAIAAAMALSVQSQALDPTQSFDVIDSETVIVGNGDLNVIEIKDLSLDSETLWLQGGETDVFVLNVGTAGLETFNMDRGLIRGDGILPHQVLINIIGDIPKGLILGHFKGTVLDFRGAALLKIQGGGLNGTLISNADKIEVRAPVSGVYFDGWIPEPATLCLLGLGALVLRRRRR
jgi:hypothetical protein